MSRAVIQWALHTEGSTRTAALIRIGLAVTAWVRWGSELLFFEVLSPFGFVLALAFFFATTAMFFGIGSRAATFATAVVTLVMYYFVGHALGRTPWTHHHTYLQAFATLLLACTPCGRSYSVDRWLTVREAEREGTAPPPERGNLYGLRLIALQLSVVYVFAAIDKTTLAFLSGDRLEHILALYYIGSDYPYGIPGFHSAMMLVAIATVALEYALGFGMLHPRLRRRLVIPGLLLHGSFYVLLPVQTYTATVAVLYLAYFDADAVHAIIDRLSGVTGRATAQGGVE